MRSLTFGMTVSALALMLSACAVGPNFRRPETAVPGHFSETRVGKPGEPIEEFWLSFEDPVLSQIIEDALERNTDLRAALANLDAARAITRQSRLDLFPTVTASGSGSKSLSSEAALPGVPSDARKATIVSGNIDASWELDLFGRVRRTVEASKADAAAVGAELSALQVSIAAEVATNYFQLRGAQERLAVTQRNVQNQQQTVQLTQSRYDIGTGTELDLQRARAQLASTLAAVPPLENDVAVAEHRLAVLSGRQPQELVPVLGDARPLPPLPEEVAVGSPAELLRRRPDIQAAERRLAASTARIGVAVGDLFPRIVLGGSSGYTATSLSDLVRPANRTWSYGPSVSWPLLDIGRVRARISQAGSTADASLAVYQGTVLQALEETENALTGFVEAKRAGEYLQQSAAASEAALKLADIRFQAGATDFLQVLDAQRTQLTAEDSLVQSRVSGATYLVAVYKAVAGGWSQHLPRSVEVAR